jgi:hypothetical protein
MKRKMTLFLGVAAVLLSVSTALAAEADRAGMQRILSAPLSPVERDVKLLSWFEEQFAQGASLSEADKELYQQLKSRVREERGGEALDNQGGPDAYQYMFMDNVAPDTVTYSWIELRGDAGATFINSWTDHDDGYSYVGTTSPGARHPIGFSFPFYGVMQDSFRLCTNGFVQFTTTSSSLSNGTLPNTGVSGPAIFAYWDDLHLDRNGQTTNQVMYRNFGTYLVIEFDSIGVYNSSCGAGGTTNTLKFEVILFSNGSIKIQYNTVNVCNAQDSSMTVGIQSNGAAGSAALQYCYGTGTTLTGPLPVSGRAIRFARAAGVPNPVTNLTGNFVAPNVVLTWTDPTQDTQGNPITIDNVQVWLGAPGTGTLLGTVNPGVQSYTDLSPPTGSRTYNVRPYRNPYYGTAVPVTVFVGSPSYSNTFETDNGLWVADPTTGGWEWGTPTYASGPTAHSGTKVWGTVLAGTYVDNACYLLTMNPGVAIQSSSASVEFWYWYDTEQSWDGCTFQVSTNNGTTWVVGRPLTGYPDSMAYPTSQPCNGGLPAWGGDAGSQWAYATIPIGQWVGQTPLFRFRFGSDNISTVYAGFYFDDMVIWGLQAPQSASVSGTVTLDGLGGVMTNVTVTANGLGAPLTHPLANGTYTLPGVQVGNRILSAMLTGYHTDTNMVTVPAGGLTNQNFTLRRENPPAPTGLTGSVNTGTGVVSLNWDDSPDLQVDEYKIYRKLRTDQNWVYRSRVIGRTNSQGTDTLTVGGIYQYRVTAVDTQVIAPPVESDPSTAIELSYGALPPQVLTADTAYDDRIRLSWRDPLAPPTVEVFYDEVDQSAACIYDGLGFTAQFPFAWFAGHYQGNGPITIYRIRTRHWPGSTPGCPVQMAVFEDSGAGVPTVTPLGVTDTVVTNPLEWLDVELVQPVTVNSGSFFVAIRQMTAQRVNIGMDSCAAQHAHTFFAITTTAGPWQALDDAGFPEVLCMRAIVSGDIGGALMELSPSPVRQSSWPVANLENGKMPSDLELKRNPAAALSSGLPIAADHSAPQIGPVSRPLSLVFRPNVLPYGTDSRGRRTLDDLVRYLIYRNSQRIDSVADSVTTYANIVGSANENVPYTYYVTARYDNNAESPASNTVTARCNMPPGAPTNITLTRVGTTAMRINWTDPTVNADGTPCVDLVSVKVYRDSVLRSTVAAGVHQYLDSLLTPAQRYLWTLRAADEVPNLGPAVSASGVAGNPSYDNGFEANNGQWVANPPTGGWEWGAPTYASGPAAHSGNNVWGTVLAGPYGDNACYTLTLSLGLVVHSDTARMEFWGWYSIEGDATAWDGCNFKVSVNGGSTWQQVSPTPAYDDQATSTDNACIPGEPSWNGTTVGASWRHFTVPLGSFIGQTPVFRFSFGSDGSVTYPGFYFDDMVIWGLQASSSVAGVVREFQTNTPIASARVWAQGQPDTATTGANGAYVLYLDAGTYTMWCRHTYHCDTAYAGIVVESGSQTVHDAVMRAPHGEVSVTSISLETPRNVNVTDSLQITNTGGQCPLSFTISDTSQWLSVDAPSGSVPPDQSVTIHVLATVTGMAQGDYTSSLHIVYNSVGSPEDVHVDLHIGPEAVDGNLPLPTVFAYYQNYPNPFNATTALRFDVPQQSRVQITIFNITGQEVARPVDAVYAPGRYRLLYDASGLPSGMYLVKMSAGDYTQTGKMMLLK